MAPSLLKRQFNAPVAIFLGAAAGVCGLLVALLPVEVTAIVLIAFAFAILSAITPFAALTALVILAPLRTLIATEAPFQLPIDIGQIALIILIGAWFVHTLSICNALPRLRWSPVYIPLVLFIIIGGLTGFTAFSMSVWVSEWLKWVQMLLIVVLVLSISTVGRTWELLLFGLALAGLSNAIVGIYQFLGGSGALHLLVEGRFFRAFGTFGQPNPFGGFMGLLIPICGTAALGYALRTGKLWLHHQPILRTMGQTFFYALVTAALVIGIGVSWSRGAWLGLAASAGIVVLLLPRNVWIGFVLAALLAIIGITLWITGVLPASIVARVNSATAEYFTISDVRGVDISPENYAVVERLSHWQAALNMARANPWLGVGLGNYEIAYPVYRLINWPEPLGHAHNYYLNILAEGGILGILGYGKVWLSIIWLNWRARRHPDTLARLVLSGLLGTWTYLFVHSIFDNLYVNNLFLHLGLMLGILAVLYHQVNQHMRME